MNITILANRDLASCLAINYLLPKLTEHRLTVFLSSRVGSKQLAPALQQLQLVEQDLPYEVLFPLLARLAKGSAELLGMPQIRDLLKGRVSELDSINEGEGLAEFAASEPVLVLSIRYGLILKQPALAVPEHGVLNLHSGRLPDYKGVMATFWALLNDERTIGTTLHYIDDNGIDNGRIVAQTAMPVSLERSYLWHVLGLYYAGCQAMAQAVHTVAAGDTVTAQPQATDGHYYSLPDAADLQRFADKGWRLFDNDDVIYTWRRFLP